MQRETIEFRYRMRQLQFKEENMGFDIAVFSAVPISFPKTTPPLFLLESSNQMTLINRIEMIKYTIWRFIGTRLRNALPIN